MNPSSILGEELNEDSFLPPSGSSLANIFGSERTNNSATSSDSLKYTPPKPPNLNKTKEESLKNNVEAPAKPAANKTSECVMAKVVHAHELINGAYETRGKLGLAILRMFCPPHTTLVLFNSEKQTFSSAVASEYLEVTIQSNNYITYYDEMSKYWSIHFSNSQDLSDTMVELKKYGIKINEHFEKPDSSIKTPDINSTEENNISNKAMEQTEARHASEKEIESSDDVQKSKQAKLALLNRMAMMGQAILPPRLISSDRTSESSDENTPPKEKPPPPPRNKVVKPTSVGRKTIKLKNLTESSDSSCRDLETVQVSSIVPGSNVTVVPATTATVVQPNTLFMYVNGQIVPVPSSDTANSSLNVFLSEMRTSSSEVRINVNRVADKVEQVLDKLKMVENLQASLPNTLEGSSTFTMDIYQKLLKEYEEKIKVKDDFIHSLEEKLQHAYKFNHPTPSMVTTEVQQVNDAKLAELMKTCENFELSIAVKNDEIEKLKLKLGLLESECEFLQETIKKTESLKEENFTFFEKITSLQLELEAKERQIEELNKVHFENTAKLDKMKLDNSSLIDELSTEKIKSTTSSHTLDIESKIKKIMNNTFRALSANFEDDKSFSGSDIRSVIASVIRQTTLEALELAHN